MKKAHSIIRIGLFAFITMLVFNPDPGLCASSHRKATKRQSIRKAKSSSRPHSRVVKRADRRNPVALSIVSSPDESLSLNNQALLLYSQGKYAEAEPLYRRSLAIRKQRLGTEHPLVATSLNNLALLLDAQARYAEAEPLSRRALVIDEKALGTGHLDVASDLNNLAALLQAQGKYAEAEPFYRRSLAIREKLLGRDHADVAQSLNNLAALLQDQGKYTEAEPLIGVLLRSGKSSSAMNILMWRWG